MGFSFHVISVFVLKDLEKIRKRFGTKREPVINTCDEYYFTASWVQNLFLPKIIMFSQINIQGLLKRPDIDSAHTETTEGKSG